MMKLKKHKKTQHAGIIIWLGFFVLASISCKNPTSPDDEALQANIIASNECGVTADVYMDGNLQFSVEYQYYNTIENVSLGTHELEAKKQGTETLVAAVSAEVSNLTNYVWNILSSINLIVSNEYGEILSIYAAGNYLDDLSSPGTMTIQNVPYGEHLLEAVRPSDETKVASITINIDEKKEYYWTISK